ncbi:hypothetical protein [Halochromatium roseum]|uniref:hypothetical protein n=1 Tax=Halochromatium roseum TaxID=391920 RepID=UPI0019149367|nr:hypothetical protein [Halochromatium roseum]MBK5940703.1 hypothetical protein [Halochromatium roseum]
MNSRLRASERQEAEGALNAQLRSVASDTPVILDFDETLWLRNSTEVYLQSLWPRLPAVLILFMLEWLRPWCWLTSNDAVSRYRDWLRVLTTTLLMPWNLLLWRRKARQLGPRYANRRLLEMLDQGPAVPLVAPLVATFGLRPIVDPLLRAIDPRLRLCVAGGFWSAFRLRRQGKWAALQQVLGEQTARRALYVTDSAEDQDVLNAVRHPVLARWPDARYEDALARGYIPFLYSSRGKRTGKQYISQVVLKRDVMVLILAFAWTQPNPLLAAAALLLMHLSFWLVYEIGYQENDVIGEQHEQAPTLASGYSEMRDRMDPTAAWTASLLIAAPGLLLLLYATDAPTSSSQTPQALIALAFGWVCYLIAARQAFRLYNQRQPESRGLLYLLLQLFRSIGYALFIPATTVGAALCIAHVLVSWLPYLAYRYSGLRLETPDRLLYIVHFLFIALTLGLMSRDLTTFLTSQSAAILLYFGWRARLEAGIWLQRAGRIDAVPRDAVPRGGEPEQSRDRYQEANRLLGPRAAKVNATID